MVIAQHPGTSTGAPSDEALSQLRSRLAGALVLPGDPTYDEARRVFNAMIDRYPAAIAQCAGAADVVAAVNFAREHDVLVAVRGGGHNVAGQSVCDGGLVIDLGPMKGIEVDAERRVVTAEAGLRLGELIPALERHGFVTPTGTVSNTGLAGLTLGAGFGYLCGKYGLAIDNMAGAEIVTADGQVLHASETEHPDLFWAIRGGSGNFGIVTRFELKLHPITQVLSGMLLYPFPAARDVLRLYRDVAASAPDELTIYAAIVTGPDGRQAVGLIPCWCGDMAEGERVLAPVRAFGPPIMDMVGPMPYSTVNTLVDAAAPPGLRHYWKQNLLRELSDEAIDVIIDFAARVPSPRTAILIDHAHGAAHRVDPSAMAFPNRENPHGLVILSMWERAEEDATNIAWTRELADATRRFSTGLFYINETLDEPIRAAFGPNYDRLTELKATYDPTNLFRHNANIPPKAAG